MPQTKSLTAQWADKLRRQPLAPKGGNDEVMTPRPLAEAILQHFRPSGKLLEPCYGQGAFTTAWSDWLSLQEGQDFLTHDFHGVHYDWIVTNPPWSKLRSFLQRSLGVADNVVFLCLVNAFWMKARLRDIEEAGFGFREILLVDTPPEPWPQAGFQLGATHLMRGWTGDLKISKLGK